MARGAGAGCEVAGPGAAGGASVLIEAVADWMIERALGGAPVEDLLAGCCTRLRAAGVPVWRAHLAFNTLHPMFAARTVTWREDCGVEVAAIPHRQDSPEGWLRSPLYHLVRSGVRHLRRRLRGPRPTLDFPVLVELRDAGASDYVAYAVAFGETAPVEKTPDGIVGSWASDHPGGFTDADLRALMRLETRVAIACKLAGREEIARNLVTAYLGAHAGRRVLDGTIRRGDGEDIHAVIWFCDLRDSTALSARLERAAFFALLNRFFECMAGAILAHGGEVLRFIGDAVLAIFPVETAADGAREPCVRALAAAQEAARRVGALNAERGGEPLGFGIGLHVGDVMYGNIGSPERVEFTVIGRAANEAARIESLCKVIGEPVVVSDAFALLHGGALRPLGRYPLRGVEGGRELFAPPGTGAAR